jgi:hypothetical protein
MSGATLGDELEASLQVPDLTMGRLNDSLDERGIALVLMLLLLPSALPVPTGGVTHVLELFALLVAGQMVVGRDDLWLPRRLRDHRLGETFTTKAGPKVLRFVRWVERLARPRGARVLAARPTVAALGVLLLVFVLGTLVAPPFSGLDTLPALGVVLVCLGLLFGDALVVVVGMISGASGIALIVVLGRAAWSLL